MEIITGSHNPKLKLLSALRGRHVRDKQGLFVVEGIRLAEEAARSEFSIEFGVYAACLIRTERGQRLLDALQKKHIPMYETTDALMAKVSEVETPQGIIMAVKQRNCSLGEWILPTKPLLVVLDRVQDPGNVGTIIRTADAAGVDGIIALKGTADIFGAKVIRSTMGSVFHLPIAVNVGVEELANFLQTANITPYAALLNDSAKPFYDIEYESAALVFGNEGGGVAQSLQNCCQAVHIPMYGAAESLNVSSAAAILIYEVLRRRRGWR